MNIKRFLLSFFLVASIVLGLGYVAILHLTDFLQQQYLESQMTTNKQSANNLTIFIENQLNSGYGKQQIMQNFQSALEKTNTQEGFIGLYDRYNAELISHPDKDRIGMQLTAQYIIEDLKTGNRSKLRNMILSETSGGGLLHTPHEKYVVYIAPVAGSDWVLAVHKNPKKINAKIASQEMFELRIIIGIAILSGLCAGFLSAFFEKRMSREVSEFQNSGNKQQKLEANLKHAQLQLEKKQEKLEALEELQLSLNERIEKGEDRKNKYSAYARKAQKALLPAENYWATIFKEHFFIYRPENSIGKDFCRLKQAENIVILVTGRLTFAEDTPAAVLNNLLCISFLNDIISELLKNTEKLTAAVIGEELTARLHSAGIHSSENDDAPTPDMAFLIIETDTFKVQFASANRPLYIVRNRKMTEVSGDKVSGKEIASLKHFTNKRAQLKQGDILYLFSDGFYNQEENEESLRASFKHSLPELSSKSLDGQRIILEDTLTRRYKKQAQKDDILIAGIRL